MSMLHFETVKRDSLLTRLNFRTKMLLVIVIMLVGVIWTSPIANTMLALALILACLLAGVNVSYIRGIILMLLPFWLILILIHGFFSDPLVIKLSGHQDLTPLLTIPKNWWLIGGTMMSVEGTLFAINVISKTLAMVLSVPLAIFTTDIDTIVVGMVRSGIPYKIAFVFSSTLRFFPLLFEEIQKIIEAQRLRGLALEKMNILLRLRVYSRIGIPLLLSAMIKSQQLEVVLQAKGFCDNPNRTYLNDTDLTRDDRITTFILVFLVVLVVILRFTTDVGKFRWLIYP